MDKKSWENWFLSFLFYAYREKQWDLVVIKIWKKSFLQILLHFIHNDAESIIARRSRGDPDRSQTSLILILKKPLCGHCFTVIRNSRGASKSPSVSLCSPAPLAGSENYNDLFSPLRGGDVRRTEGVGTKVSLK